MPNIIEPDTKFKPRVNASLEPQIDWAAESIILGRDRQGMAEFGLKGTMELGVICEHQSAGASLFGYKVLFDNKFPHIIFICGKRGSGKSYTLGVIVEELARSKSGIGTIVIDPIGTFWTMRNKNRSTKVHKILQRYGLQPQDFDNIQVVTPIGFYNDLKASVDGAFSIAVSDLSADDWCMVFDIERFKTQGLLIGDIIDKINNGYYAQVGKITKNIPPKKKKYTIGDVIFCIKNDVSINSAEEGYAVATRRSVIARFKAAAKWGIFSVSGTSINEMSIRNKITILDVSHSKLGSSKRALLVGIITRKILEARIEASRIEEARRMGLDVAAKKLIPVTWLVIDEAHLLLPRSGKTAASEALIEFAKLGRKPGCGLVFATQRPAATNDNVLSQVDTIIGHNLALEDDISALRRRIPAKVPQEFRSSDFIRSMPVGLCLMADQKTQQRTMLVQIRPRLTHHSGKAAMPKSDEEAALMETMDLKHEAESIVPLDLNESVGTSITVNADDIMKPSIDVSVFDDHIDEEKDEDKEEKTCTKVGEHRLDWGGAYIIISKDPEFGLDIFGNFSKKVSARNLSITRMHPDKINKGLLPDNTTNKWLSKSSEEDSIPPGNITQIAHIINEFIKSNDKSVIFLDGLEYLINHNDFPKVLKFIETIHEKIILRNGVLFIPINPAALSNNYLELLENELSNTIKDPSVSNILPQTPETETMVNKKVQTKHEQETQPKIRGATKDDLKELCKKLGLKTTGTVEELKNRILENEKRERVTPATSIAPDTPDALNEPEALETQNVLEPIPIKAGEDGGKYRDPDKTRTEAEPKKPKSDRAKLQGSGQTRTLEPESKKLQKEREKLQREKKDLESQRKDLEKRFNKAATLKREKKDKAALEPKLLVVRSKIKGRAVEEYAIKQLKTSLFGKPLEVIKSIRPVYLPLLRVYVKAIRGSIFAKEHEGVFYWDTITGEVITNMKNVLKRSIGIATLMTLPTNQAKVLAALNAWGTNDVVDIKNDINISASEVKRALTALKKRSLVTIVHNSEKKIDNYKRMVELKIPHKFDKVKAEIPEIGMDRIQYHILESRFKINDLEKILIDVLPGARIIKCEKVNYPYFQVDIVGKTGPKTIFIDAVTGTQDIVLTKYLQFN